MAGAVVVLGAGEPMRLVIRILGLELLSVEASTDDEPSGPFRGDCATTPIGFAPDVSGCEWQAGVER